MVGGIRVRLTTPDLPVSVGPPQNADSLRQCRRKVPALTGNGNSACPGIFLRFLDD